MNAPSMARRLAAAAGGAAATALLTTLPLPAAAVTVTVSDTDLVPGQPVTITATGLTPHDQYRICGASSGGQQLCSGLYTASASTMTRTVVVPATFVPGVYTGTLIDVTTGAVVATRSVTVESVGSGGAGGTGTSGTGTAGLQKGLPNTGGNPDGPAGAATAVATLAAIGVSAGGVAFAARHRRAAPRRHCSCGGSSCR